MYGAGIKRRLGLTGFSLDSQERLLGVVMFELKSKSRNYARQRIGRRPKTFRCVLNGQRQRLIEQGREHGERSHEEEGRASSERPGKLRKKVWILYELQE